MQKKAHMWCVLQFGTICPIMKHKKHLQKYINFGECYREVYSFPKTNNPPQMMQIVPNPKQDIFSGCFGLFF